MNKRKLGRTGLQVSEISFGTWAFGNKVYGGVNEREAINTVNQALDLGVNLFDTAPQYGTSSQDGVAEIILGKALKGKRKDVFISTKFGRNPCIENGSSQFYKSRVIASVDESLGRLKTDYIDVLFFHSPFSSNEIHDDVWEGIELVKKQGKVRYIGHSISMFSETEQMARKWANENKIDVIQVVLNLMNRESKELISDLSEMGIGVFARECMANGFLSGMITTKTVFPKESLNSRYSVEELEERIAQVKAFNFLIRKDVENMPQAALRWVLDQRGVSTALSGAKNISELKQAISATNLSSFTKSEQIKCNQVLNKNFEPA